ncbi:MAG: phage portal protein [Clostridia bacterium]|nr:phage portal protein [Clostridia bacterium]
MKSYQELLSSAGHKGGKGKFCLEAVKEQTASEFWRTARDAEAYYRHRNPTIARAQKMIYTLLGEAVPDVWRPNHKIPSRYYHYFITQQVEYLLGNGVSLAGAASREKLGRGFDRALQRAAVYALNAGVSFGFWNADRLEVFPFCGTDEPSFCPLWDEEDGTLRAGIRWWRLGEEKPLRMTLYEPEGTTDYVLHDSGGEVRSCGPRRGYAGGEEGGILGGRLPIVPFSNVNRQSELVGSRAALDAYDLLLSGLVNNTDEGNLIYWVLKNCNAMDEEDDAAFLAGLRRTRVVHADGDDGAAVEAHTVEVPYDASEAALSRLRSQLFDDFMALDVKNIAAGTPTATQIAAAYEPLNAKTDAFEYCVLEFLEGIFPFAGISPDAHPSFRRSVIANQKEEIGNILSAAPFLDRDTVTEQLCAALGLSDRTGEILRKKREEEEKNGKESGDE